MKKTLVTTMSSLLLFTIVNSQLTYAATYTSLQEAKKAHPNASFNVNSNDGTFTYTYGQQRRGSNDNHKPQSHAHGQAGANQGQRTSQAPGSTSQSPLGVQQNVGPVKAPEPSQPVPSIATRQYAADASLAAESQNEQADFDKVYKKDDSGMITSINVDGLYDELKLNEFNDKAMTVDGKPLALGNGKIISNPLFTSKNNLYTAGQCTWYVFDKRAQAGHTISTFWGDARNWAGQASGDGFKVDHKPEKGAILQTGNGPYGHVAFVERVNADGSVFISEMNWIAPYITSTRTISSMEAGSYNYIH